MAIQPRRRFLKNAFATLFLPVVSPLSKFLSPGRQEADTSVWVKLVEYARWCPSVHNLQPHKLKIISEHEAELYYDPARLLPIGDPGAIFVTVAMGIFQEHLSIAASLYNQRIIISEVVAPIKTGNHANTLFARLKLVPQIQKEELDPGLILKRRTSRIKYDSKPVQEEIVSKLKQETAAYQYQLFSSSEPELVDYILNLNQETLFKDLSSKANCDELNHLFRYTEAEAKTRKDGLWAKCMGFPGPLMQAVFTHPEKWLNGLRKKFLAKRYMAPFKGTTTLCWINGKFDNPTDWLQAGRVLARNWLILTQNNIYIQPFGSLITNATAYEKIKTKLGPLTEGEKTWIIFRAGYSQEPAKSFRLSTAEIIIT